MSANESRENIELLAELVGSTSAQMKELDEQIISSSANLQQSNAAWDPTSVLKEGVQSQRVDGGGMPPPSPSAVAQQPLPPPVQQPPQPVPVQQPSQPVIVQAATPPEVQEQLNRIESKLDKFVSELDRITTLDKKLTTFVDKGLKNNVKQITLKLDGNSSR